MSIKTIHQDNLLWYIEVYVAGRISSCPGHGFYGWGSAASCRCLVASCHTWAELKPPKNHSKGKSAIIWRIVIVDVFFGQLYIYIIICLRGFFPHDWLPDGIFWMLLGLLMFLTLAHWISGTAFLPIPNRRGVHNKVCLDLGRKNLVQISPLTWTSWASLFSWN